MKTDWLSMPHPELGEVGFQAWRDAFWRDDPEGYRKWLDDEWAKEVAGNIRYLTRVPTEPPEPGTCIVHNHVRPARYLSLRGFRAWRQNLDLDRLEVCDCPWAPKQERHYRVRRAVQTG
jgi:hypothetical protein